jgi:flagellar motor switch protein FliG
MVTFEQLERASDPMIEKILEHVERATLATALQGASVRMVERVMGGRSSQEIGTVLECIREQQAASLAEVESARKQVAALADELKSAGIPLWDAV